MTKQAALYTYSVLIASILLVGAGCSFGASTSITPTSTQTIATTTAVCDGCVLVSDNGKTFSLKAAQSITIGLNESDFDKNSLAITSTGKTPALTEIEAPTPPPGMWTRSFEGVTTGLSVISVYSRNPTTPPFMVTLMITSSNQHPTTTASSTTSTVASSKKE